MPSVSITKRFRFEAAHVLPNHPGKCSRLHGHSYRLDITVKGPLLESGMVMDFHDLGRIVREVVIDRVDHTMLNDLLENPTAENLALAVWEWLTGQGIQLAAVTVHETATSRATVTP